MLQWRRRKLEPIVSVASQQTLRLLFILVSATPVAAALVTDQAPGEPAVDCRAAATLFEQSAKLPPGLLLAIGQVESGRFNPITQQVDPWPWTTNRGGEGRYFASARDAIGWVEAQQAVGYRSIDVGCFQVNLQYHPSAFASLEAAFDPVANARYAADLLNRLHDNTGNWRLAIAQYHSAEPLEGERYSSRVSRAWENGDKSFDILRTVAPRPTDPVVVRIASGAAAVRIVVPAWATVQSNATRPIVRSGLPRVFTPGGPPTSTIPR